MQRPVCSRPKWAESFQRTQMTNANTKFTYFLIGIALPVTAYLLWFKTDWFRGASKRHQEIDRSHDITVEDSFPASDPPSAW